MAATSIGIIYGADSGIVRRIVIPDEDAQLAGHVGPGEALLTIPRAAPHDVISVTAAVAKATGKDIPDSRCAVIDKAGVVVEMIHADPALDAVDGHDLATCYAKEVSVGATYDAKTGLFADADGVEIAKPAKVASP